MIKIKDQFFDYKTNIYYINVFELMLTKRAHDSHRDRKLVSIIKIVTVNQDKIK